MSLLYSTVTCLPGVVALVVKGPAQVFQDSSHRLFQVESAEMHPTDAHTGRNDLVDHAGR